MNEGNRSLLRDLTSHKAIIAKGFAFLFLGLLSSALLLTYAPSLIVACLLLIAVWSFCRFYYFAFYVLEHYVDPGYRFDGLISLVRYFRQRH